MSNPIVWNTTIDEIMRIFRDALRNMVPIAERAKMQWREPNNYDDWDEICKAIYNSIVVRSIEYSNLNKEILPIIGYDNRVNIYRNNSFIAHIDGYCSHAFICFETNHIPFDTCLFAEMNDAGVVETAVRLNSESLRFSLAARSGDGISIVDAIDVSL